MTFELHPERRGLLVFPGRGDRLSQQAPGRVRVAAVKQVLTRMQHFLRSTLTLRERSPCPIDIGARPGMRSIQEQGARPDVNRVLVAAGKISVQSLEQESFHLTLVVDSTVGRGFRFEA